MFAICRICLLAIDKTNSISIYAELASKKSILNIMKECASIGILDEDSLPKFICTKCTENLDFVNEFRKLIISSDIHLKEKLKLSGDDDFSGDDLLGEVGDQEIEEKEINVDSKEWLLDENCLTDSLKHTDEANPTKANNTVKERVKIDKDLSKNNSKKRIRRKQLYECKECDVVFKTPCSFKNHNIKHTGIKPYSCEYCGKGFAMKWAVILHTRVHTGDKPLTCDVCQKKFGSPSGLHNHKRIHDKAKRLYCEICNKAFSDPQRLTVHMRSHTGEKPYMCEVCSKTFCGSNNLSRHMITHQENRTPCPICGKTYKGDIRYLQAHIKRHRGLKPFSCNECGRKFTVQGSLNRHKLLHAGIKLHKCKICEKSFSQGSILMRHMRIHSGEKPFACALCPKQFAYKHHLQGHMKSHQGSESTNDGEKVVGEV